MTAMPISPLVFFFQPIRLIIKKTFVYVQKEERAASEFVHEEDRDECQQDIPHTNQDREQLRMIWGHRLEEIRRVEEDDVDTRQLNEVLSLFFFFSS